MGKNFIDQFNSSDSVSNDATIALINSLSNKQKRVLLKMVNSKNEEAFEEMRKGGRIQ